MKHWSREFRAARREDLEYWNCEEESSTTVIGNGKTMANNCKKGSTVTEKGLEALCTEINGDK